MRIKQPNWKQTYKLVKRLADYISFGMVAKHYGKTIQTAEGWGREPESSENPFGSGRRNPLDGACKLVALAHKEDAALAREIAETTVDYCDFLDDQKGKKFAENGGCIKTLCANSIKEHTDVVVKILEAGDGDNIDFDALLTELNESESAIKQLKICAKEKARNIISANVFSANGSGNHKSNGFNN